MHATFLFPHYDWKFWVPATPPPPPERLTLGVAALPYRRMLRIHCEYLNLI